MYVTLIIASMVKQKKDYETGRKIKRVFVARTLA